MTMSVVIPVHNGGEEFGLCLEALRASSRCPEEIVAADAASTDGSAVLAVRYGAQVVCLKGPPHGPAL